MSDFIERWSPNFDERALPISMIVLHYTGMKSGAEAPPRYQLVRPAFSSAAMTAFSFSDSDLKLLFKID